MAINTAKKRLLFTGGGGAGSEAFCRLLAEDYEAHFADADIEAKPCSIPLNQWHKIPFANDKEFVEELRCLCRELNIDILIPGVDEELLPIAKARESMGCNVLMPPVHFVETHLDKFTSFLCLSDKGLPVPHTERLLERQRVTYPCIAKPRHGRGSRDVATVRSEEEMQAHILLSRRLPEEFILQELLLGNEYTVMMAANHDGRLRAVVPVRVAIKRGITLRAATHADKKVIAACVAIHEANPVPGCYNIQLMKTDTGDVKPFEINPRISTTACLGFVAGVDFIEIYLSNVDGGSLLTFRDGLGLRRYWYNNFV